MTGARCGILTQNGESQPAVRVIRNQRLRRSLWEGEITAPAAKRTAAEAEQQHRTVLSAGWLPRKL